MTGTHPGGLIERYFKAVPAFIAACALTFCVLVTSASGETASADAIQRTGPETNLPLPRFVSMKAAEGNVRRGPSLTHRIDWVFQHRNMPLQVVGEYGHWRRVIDREGAGGWMHYALLSGVRTVIVEEDLTAIRTKPNDEAQIRARAEAGVIAELDRCTGNWCRIEAGRTRGWVQADALWGLDEDLLSPIATEAAAR